EIKRYLDTRVLRYARHYDRHAEALRKFHEIAPFEKSVFIMTKYPDDNTGAADRQLQKVIDAAKSAVTAAGLKPRLASDANYHSAIWDNVEVNALGCGLGIGIVEDRYRAELNPNVAMEWGWMRGMGRTVIFLVERNFKNFRADVEGLIKEQFDWDDPAGTIPSAVAKAIEAMR